MEHGQKNDNQVGDIPAEINSLEKQALQMPINN